MTQRLESAVGADPQSDPKDFAGEGCTSQGYVQSGDQRRREETRQEEEKGSFLCPSPVLLHGLLQGKFTGIDSTIAVCLRE
jgi:hypothetical protein